ncbi:hypothetical protein Tco_1534637 [Tanacetum coccineum]
MDDLWVCLLASVIREREEKKELIYATRERGTNLVSKMLGHAKVVEILFPWNPMITRYKIFLNELKKELRVLLLHLIFAFPCKLRATPGVPTYFNNWVAALLQTLDLAVHDFDSKSFVGYAFLQIRDVKRAMNSAQLLWEFKIIGDSSNLGKNLKRSNVSRVHLSLSTKTYHPFSW